MKPQPISKSGEPIPENRQSVSPNKTNRNRSNSTRVNQTDTSINLNLPPYIHYLSIYDTISRKHVMELTRIDSNLFPIESIRKDNGITIQRSLKGRFPFSQVKTRDSLKKEFKWAQVLTKTQLLISSVSLNKQLDENVKMTAELNHFLDDVVTQIDRKDIENNIIKDLDVFLQEFSLKNKVKSDKKNFGSILDKMTATLITGKEQLEEIDAQGRAMARDAREFNSQAEELASESAKMNRILKIILIIAIVILAITLIAILVVLSMKQKQQEPVARQLFQDVNITGIKIARKLMKVDKKGPGELHRRWVV